MTHKDIADAIAGSFVSPNCSDANGEPANVVDGLYAIAAALRALAAAVTETKEAGIALKDIAEAINRYPAPHGDM